MVKKSDGGTRGELQEIVAAVHDLRKQGATHALVEPAEGGGYRVEVHFPSDSPEPRRARLKSGERDELEGLRAKMGKLEEIPGVRV